MSAISNHQAEPALDTAIHAMFPLVVEAAQNPKPDSVARAGAAIARLEALVDGTPSDDLRTLSAHARLLIASSEATDRHLRQLVKRPAAEQIALVQEDYLRYYRAREEAERPFRYLQYGLAAALAFARLQLSRLATLRANRALKAEIASREEKERALVESEQRYAEQSRLFQTTLDSIDQGFWVLDRDLKLVAWNRPWRELHRPGDEVWQGMPAIELYRRAAQLGLYGEVDIEVAADEMLRKTLDGTLPVHTERTLPDGRTFQLRRYSMPDGGLVGTVSDVTERRRAENALRLLTQAVEQSVAMVMIADRNRRIEYVNPKLREVTGYAPEELIGWRT